MSRFSEKLDGLPQTAKLIAASDLEALGEALRDGRDRPVIAIGSGGSTIAAHYFARCRETLFEATTQVVTPAEFVFGNDDLAKSDVWLFSAGADNADSLASVVAARARGAARIILLTRNAAGAAAVAIAADPASAVITVPVADPKDGFLATHSLVGSVFALLFASDIVSAQAQGQELRLRAIADIDAALDPAVRESVRTRFANLRSDDVLLLIADPQIRVVAELIETSLWETALCAVQRTDLRNFAHGRHAWLHHRADKTVVLALSTDDGREVWERADALLPPSLRRHVADFGNAGRLRSAIGIIEGLVIVEAIGAATGIDPGKPGIGDFGRSLYEEAGLLDLARQLNPSVRHKRAASLERDDILAAQGCVRAASIARRTELGQRHIGAIIFDYDGTIISDEERFGQPRQAIIDELVRLDALGVRLAIATGRGGSGGKALRGALPAELHERITMGYYNGAYVQPLSVDIEVVRPQTDPALAETFAWLKSHPELFLNGSGGRFSDVQISIKLEDLVDRPGLPAILADCAPIASGAVRYKRSGHSIDFFAAGTSKLTVVYQVRASLPDDAAVICVGDSGGRDGNDHELLSHAHGISVGTVCDRHDGCWSLFGNTLTGPQALLRILQAVKRDGDGSVRMDMSMLRLDSFAK
jgi:fructoselysine-6-P-deglycase FrlB-like protein/hydroxymethylpyrimidine pyrophosphatase-like HAD family hydrolase